MGYNICKDARIASWRCLIDCGVSELPVKPVQIAKHYGVECIDYAPLLRCGESGKILRREDGRVQIILDQAQPETRKRVTILHELGHYLLGHLDAVPLATPGDSTAWHPAECAAEQFAVSVLMPACVLWGLDIHTPVDIASVCNVSQRAARMRAERMETLYKQDRFLTHPLECQVYSQFHAFFRAAKKEKTTLSGQSGL